MRMRPKGINEARAHANQRDRINSMVCENVIAQIANLKTPVRLGSTSAGDLWLQNGNGVIMHLVAKRQGLMLSLGGDAVVIQMNQ
jgi:hypothetical protein